MPYWIEEEEELLKESWLSGKYPPEELAEIFQRSFDALRMKAKTLNLEPWETVEARVRVKNIREAMAREYAI